MRCWCGHGADSHGPRRDGRTHCVACERGRQTYFVLEHEFRPIATLRPLPQILFSDLFGNRG
jgi:hypothetical protein